MSRGARHARPGGARISTDDWPRAGRHGACRGKCAQIDLRAALPAAIPCRRTPSGHDALVVLGGGQNALDDDDLPYFPPLLALMRDFGDSGPLRARRLPRQPASGARLWRAKTCSARRPSSAGRASRRRRKAEPTRCSARCRKSSDLPVARRHLHPAGGRGASCPQPPGADNQAFRVGRAAYGIQFHFEADRSAGRAAGTTAFADYPRRAPARLGRPPRGRRRRTHGPAADAAGLALARAWVGDDSAGRPGFEGDRLI